MLNMNFFNEYILQRKAEQKKLYRNIILFVVLAFLVGGAYGYLHWSNQRSQERIATAQGILSLDENVTFREEINTSKATLQILNTYRESLKQSDAAIAGGIKINRALLDKIMAAMPEGTQLTAVNFSGFTLRLSGNLAGPYLAPSLLADLRATGYFVDIAPITLTNEQGVTLFTATCILKGGALQ